MPEQPQTIRVGASVLNQTALDIEGNSRRIRVALTEARAAGVQVLCLPELCLTGYGSEDMFLSAGFVESAMEELVRLAPATAGLITSVGLPLLVDGSIYNSVAVLADGQIVGFAAKQNLAKDGLHYEPRWFQPWSPNHRADVRVGQERLPVGDLIFDAGLIRIGFEICEDAWVSDRPLSRLVERGVNLILNPSASHFAFGKNQVRRQLVLDAVQKPGLAYIYANLLGNEAGRAIYDGDAYIGIAGQIRNSGPRFSFQDHVLTIGDIEFNHPESKPDSDSIPVKFEFTLAEDASGHSVSGHSVSGHRAALDSERQEWESCSNIKEEEFTRSVSLGLFDYVRKSRSRGVVISLSGGADSAAVTCLSRLMLDLAVAELGLDAVVRRLGCQHPESIHDLKQLRFHLICTAYQATRNSSDITRSAAQAVAVGCDSEHFELEIDSIVEDYKRIVAEALQRELTWELDDIALQNIQARSRSPSIWMFANIRNALLISTSNRSEAAVGYATMDGDTSGGLAPIAGIDKAFLRSWLTWLAQKGPVGIGPFAFLDKVNAQQPTAELRPLSQNQTDEDDLMPYPVLDFIERCAIRDKLMPREIVDKVMVEFNDTLREQAVFWIQRFFRLWCRNQWKRERYAPSFHLDDESLDPKTWCRFPILSGGFEEELRGLK